MSAASVAPTAQEQPPMMACASPTLRRSLGSAARVGDPNTRYATLPISQPDPGRYLRRGSPFRVARLDLPFLHPTQARPGEPGEPGTAWLIQGSRRRDSHVRLCNVLSADETSTGPPPRRHPHHLKKVRER